jgi:hypothetical protein
VIVSAALAVVTVILTALFATIVVVRWAIRGEERYMTLTRTAPSARARLARHVCGVYICGMGPRPLRAPGLDQDLAWLEHAGGTSRS